MLPVFISNISDYPSNMFKIVVVFADRHLFKTLRNLVEIYPRTLAYSTMFEGMPLPISPLHVYALPLGICVFGVGATALLRVQFDREWALTMWTAYQIKRVWQRLADESARTGGTLTSHAIGLLAWALLGSLWGVNASATPALETAGYGAMWGALLGLTALIARHLGGWMGAWVTLEHDAVQRGFEVDRHMRNWLPIIALYWELAQFTVEGRGAMDAREHGGGGLDSNGCVSFNRS